MPTDVKPPHVLRRPRRSAVENRARTIAEAATLFATAGFAGTTMEAVAAASGMSVQSIYFNFRNKATLLQAALDAAALGAVHPSPPMESDWYRAAAAEPDAALALAAFVHGNCGILHQTAPLTLAAHAAGASDAAARDLHRRNEALRLRVYADMTQVLAAKRPLRAGVSLDAATDVVFAVLSPHMHQLLTVDRHWTAERFEEWVIGALRRELW